MSFFAIADRRRRGGARLVAHLQYGSVAHGGHGGVGGYGGVVAAYGSRGGHGGLRVEVVVIIVVIVIGSIAAVVEYLGIGTPVDGFDGAGTGRAQFRCDGSGRQSTAATAVDSGSSGGRGVMGIVVVVVIGQDGVFLHRRHAADFVARCTCTCRCSFDVRHFFYFKRFITDDGILGIGSIGIVVWSVDGFVVIVCYGSTTMMDDCGDGEFLTLSSLNSAR